MADNRDLDQGPDDLYDDAPPRSIFAATWFRAVLVLIVLGVIGAVAVPYILDAMNAPPGQLSATATAPTPVASSQPPAPPASAPPVVAPTPSTPAPPPTPTTSPTPPTASDTPSEKAAKDRPLAPTTPAAESPKAEPAPAPKPATPDTPTGPSPTVTARIPATAEKRASETQWFVQVGAFKDPAAAKRVATRLRDDKYQVDEWVPRAATVAKATTVRPSASDRYDVIVAGQSPAELNQRLAAKSLTAEAAANGAVVRPSLPLRDAVALSKELAVDGLKVQVRRAGAPTASDSRPTAGAAGSDGLHRVAVGGFADRATAMTTLKELEAKGYKPFITRR